MAGDRVERILQTFLCCQKEARSTESVAPYRRRILTYAEDFDGEVEGPFHLILRIAPLSNAFIYGPIDKGLGSIVTYVTKFWWQFSHSNSILETTADHRARSLLEILPVALQTGYSEIAPELEPLKVQ